MKNRFKNWVLILMIVLSQNAVGQESDSSNLIARRETEFHLATITKHVNDTTVEMNEIVSAVRFFENLTKIESECMGTYLGKLDPTKKDLLAWNEWYKRNRTRIWMNPETGRVEIK